MRVKIGGLQKSSLIDYPEKISSVIFTQGCNFSCPYCHNPELIDFTSNSLINEFDVLKFLKTRVGKLDGVVITGGEPTLHNDLPSFIRQIKSMGFCIKLDTNGLNPGMLNNLINEKLIDYVAIDIKAPIEKYSEVVCKKVNTDNILKSIEILKTSGINHEYRTTVVKSQLTYENFEQIGAMIKGSKTYYLQRFVPTKTLDKSFLNEKTYSDKEFASIINLLKNYITNVELR